MRLEYYSKNQTGLQEEISPFAQIFTLFLPGLFYGGFYLRIIGLGLFQNSLRGLEASSWVSLPAKEMGPSSFF